MTARTATLALAAAAAAWGQAAGDTFRPLSLSGRVVIDDGSPLPQSAIVDLRCDGQRLPQSYTNDKGAFTFRIGGENSRSIADSQRQTLGPPVGATGGDRSYVSLTNCELEATLPGYRSTKIYLGRRSVFESADVGTLVLRRLDKGQGSLVSVKTALAPPEARKAFERAEKEWAGKRDAGKAAKDLEKAVAGYAGFAAAWDLLGRVRLAQKDAEGARAAFEKSVAADPDFVQPLVALALLAVEQQRMADAAARAGKAIELMPSLAEAQYYNAVARMSMGDAAAAESSIRAVLASPDADRFPRSRFMMGNILAQKGDLEAAASEFRKYLEAEPSSRAAGAVRKTLDEWRAAGKIR